MCTSRLRRVVGPAVRGRLEVEDVLGRREEVRLLALDAPVPQPGEWLVVHSGYALGRAGADEAEAVLEALRAAHGDRAPADAGRSGQEG